MNTYNLTLTSITQEPLPGYNLAVPVDDPNWTKIIYSEPTQDPGYRTYGNKVAIRELQFNEETVKAFLIKQVENNQWSTTTLWLDEEFFVQSNQVKFEIWSTSTDVDKWIGSIQEGGHGNWGQMGSNHSLLRSTGVTAVGPDTDTWYQYTGSINVTPGLAGRGVGGSGALHATIGMPYWSVGEIYFTKPLITVNNPNGLIETFYIPDQYGATTVNLDFSGLIDDAYKYVKILITHNQTDKIWVLQDFDNLFNVKKHILPIQMNSTLLSDNKYVVSVSALRTDMQMELYKVKATIKRPDINNYGKVDISRTLIYNNAKQSNNVLIAMETEKPRYLVNTMLRLPRTPDQEKQITLTYTDPITGKDPAHYSPFMKGGYIPLSGGKTKMHEFTIPDRREPNWYVKSRFEKTEDIPWVSTSPNNGRVVKADGIEYRTYNHMEPLDAMWKERIGPHVHTSDAYTGVQSLRIVAAPTKHGGGNYGGTWRDFPALTVGTRYRVRVWVKCLKNPGPIVFHNQSGSGDPSSLANGVNSTIIPTEGKWTYHEWTAELDKVKPNFYCWSAEPKQEWLIDDLVVEEVLDSPVQENEYALRFDSKISDGANYYGWDVRVDKQPIEVYQSSWLTTLDGWSIEPAASYVQRYNSSGSDGQPSDHHMLAYLANPPIIYIQGDHAASNVGSWVAAGGTVSKEWNGPTYDSGPDPWTGNLTMKFTSDSSDGEHFARLNNLLVVGNKYKVSGKVYLGPRDGTSQNVNHLVLDNHHAGNVAVIDTFTTKNQWVEFEAEFTAAYEHLYLKIKPDSDTWTFPGIDSQDIFHVIQFAIVDVTPVRHAIEKPNAFKPGKIYDVSGEVYIKDVDVDMYKSDFSTGSDEWEGRNAEIRAAGDLIGIAPDSGALQIIANGQDQYHRATRMVNEVVAGKKYRLSGKVFVPEGGPHPRTVKGFQIREANGTSVLGPVHPTPNTWHEFEVEYTADDTDYTGWIEIWLANSSAVDTTATFKWPGGSANRDAIYIKDFKLTELNQKIKSVNIYDYFQDPDTGGNAQLLANITEYGKWVTFESRFIGHQHTTHLEARMLGPDGTYWASDTHAGLDNNRSLTGFPDSVWFRNFNITETHAPSIHAGVWSGGEELKGIKYSAIKPVVHDFLQHTQTLSAVAGDVISISMISTDKQGIPTATGDTSQIYYMKDVVLTDPDQINPEFTLINF